jgi:hypothetical protein
MQLGLSITHHDHSYIEERGGHVFYSHVRGAPARCTYRERAVVRAFQLYERGVADGLPEPELGGRGLLVLQRALLAAEDIGGLLHALAAPDPWARLVSTTIPDLDAAFRRVVADDPTAMEPFCLPSAEILEGEDLNETQRAAALRLGELTGQRWRRQLEAVARFWLTHASAVKSTMHGFPLLAGTHVLGPPRAGEVADGIADPGYRFAMALQSRIRPTSDPNTKEVITERHVIRVDDTNVAAAKRAGVAGARVTAALCLQQAASIEHGYANFTPADLLHRLSKQEQAVLREVMTDGES